MKRRQPRKLSKQPRAAASNLTAVVQEMTDELLALGAPLSSPAPHEWHVVSVLGGEVADATVVAATTPVGPDPTSPNAVCFKLRGAPYTYRTEFYVPSPPATCLACFHDVSSMRKWDTMLGERQVMATPCRGTLVLYYRTRPQGLFSSRSMVYLLHTRVMAAEAPEANDATSATSATGATGATSADGGNGANGPAHPIIVRVQKSIRAYPGAPTPSSEADRSVVRAWMGASGQIFRPALGPPGPRGEPGEWGAGCIVTQVTASDPKGSVPAVVLRSITQTAITSQLPQGLDTMRAIIARLPRRGLDSLVEPKTGYASVMWVDGVVPVRLASLPAITATPAVAKTVAKTAAAATIAAPPPTAAAHGDSVRLIVRAAGPGNTADTAGADEDSRDRKVRAERRRIGRRLRMLLVVCGGVGLVFAVGSRAVPVPPWSNKGEKVVRTRPLPFVGSKTLLVNTTSLLAMTAMSR